MIICVYVRNIIILIIVLAPFFRCRASRLLLLFWWFFLAMITVLYVSAFVAIVQTVVFGYGPDVFTMRKFVQVKLPSDSA